jgi:hypothetical protein
MNKINLPFTTDIKKGGSSSFKILDNKQITQKIKKDKNIISLIKNLMQSNQNNNNSNKLNYVKASSTKEYYDKLNRKKIYK